MKGSNLKSKVSSSATTVLTDYCGNMIYEGGSLKQILVDGGYVTFSGSTPTYHYYLQDHLGNNRVVCNASSTVEQVNHYYPFGGLFGESTNGDTQRYKYNGKELNRMHGLDWYDYGARHMDAMRFTTMDPLAEKYYNMSPYAYCANNPVRSIDVKGDSIFVLIAPEGAHGMGHMAMLIQNKDNRWEYYSKNGTQESSGLYGEQYNDNKGEVSFSSIGEFLDNSEYNPINKKTNQRKYTEGYLIPSTSEENAKAIDGAMIELKKNYNVLGSNCAVTVQNALSAAGKNPGDPSPFTLSPYSDNAMSIISYVIKSKVPNYVYQRIKATNSGKTIKPNK